MSPWKNVTRRNNLRIGLTILLAAARKYVFELQRGIHATEAPA